LLVLTTFTDMETNMPNTPKVLIIDAVTGVEELRDMNAEELAQYEADKAEQVAKENAANAKAAAAASAVAKLEAIGLTADEIAALRG